MSIQKVYQAAIDAYVQAWMEQRDEEERSDLLDAAFQIAKVIEMLSGEPQDTELHITNTYRSY